MSCEYGNWTVRFPEVDGTSGPFEISPDEITLKMEDRKFDFCRAEFDVEIGEMMKPETNNDDGALSFAQAAEVCLNGHPVRVLHFRPDYVSYGNRGTYMELHDMQESLDSGIVDKHWDRVTLRNAYEHVFSKRDKNLIRDIKFMVPDELPSGQEIITTLTGEAAHEPSFFKGGRENYEKKFYEPENNERLLESYYALDFNKISPAQAIWELNDRFQMQTWVDSDYTLWVGMPENVSMLHVAASDDERVWRYRDDAVQIKHPRDPIFGVVVQGSWYDEPGIGGGEDSVEEVISWFGFAGVSEDEANGGAADVRAEGVAYFPDVDPEYGQLLTISDSNAKRDALPHVAQTYLYEEMKKQHSGSVELIPSLSGDQVSPMRALTVGDALHLVPEDKHFDGVVDATSGRMGNEPEDIGCGQFIHNEIYMVTGVTHNVSGGYWTVTADVAMFPDNDVEKYVRYFSPRTEEYLDEEDVWPDGRNPALHERFRIENF